MLTLGRDLVVTNGDQTDTIARFMHGNLRRLPLPPALLRTGRPQLYPAHLRRCGYARGGYKLSILKAAMATPPACSARPLTTQPVAGEGHFISTYEQNGAPIPSFAGEPLRVTLDQNDADEFAGKLWEA